MIGGYADAAIITKTLDVSASVQQSVILNFCKNPNSKAQMSNEIQSSNDQNPLTFKHLTFI